MPKIKNYTPFPNFRYYSTDSRGISFGIVIVKATYELAPSGRLLVAEEQAPMIFTDECHGAVNVSSLWHPSDLAPAKPCTDVILNAVARAPNGKATPSLACGIRIDAAEGSYKKNLVITGPRQWLPRWKRELADDEKKDWRRHRAEFDKWELSPPEAIAELPLRYEYAYGGVLNKGLDRQGKPIIEPFAYNPLGRGWIDRDWTDHTAPQPAPQIEDASELVADAYATHKPQNFGPIPPAWLPRRPLGGTYDQNWIDKVWPKWPADYSFAYHNSAHPEMVFAGLMKGNERIHLSGFLPTGKPIAFRLPGEELVVDFEDDDGAKTRKAMALDTVFLDIADPDKRNWRVLLSWRLQFTPDQFTGASLLSLKPYEEAGSVRTRIKQGQYA